MSTLLIDAGNTRIKFAVCASTAAPGAVHLSQALWQGACDTHASAEQLVCALQQCPLYVGANMSPDTQLPRVLRAVGVCVAGEVVRQRIQAALMPLSVLWLSGATPLPGLRNHYATPHTLGADRWLAAYGLMHAAQPVAPLQGRAQRTLPGNTQAAVLATFGTATTVDVLVWDSASGEAVFEGGIICAGLHSAWRSVSRSTAQLPDVGFGAEPVTPPSAMPAIPNNTHAALTLGAIYAQVGAVAQVLERVRPQHGEPSLWVSGGVLPQLAAYLPPARMIETPALLGLLHALAVLK